MLSGRLVVVEDKDLTILKALDRAIGSPLFASSSDAYVKSAEGTGNFRDFSRLGQVLKQIVDTYEIAFVQDRDGLPDFLADAYIDRAAESGTEVLLLERHEIENYLLSPDLFVRAMKSTGVDVERQDVIDTILEAAKDMKAVARTQSRKAASAVNRFLGDAEKMKNDEVEIKADEWFDSLDDESLDVVIAVWPGKELLKDVRKRIEHSHGVELTNGLLISMLEPQDVDQGLTAILKRLSVKDSLET